VREVKLVVIPAGRLGVESVTVPVKPLSEVRLIVELPEEPCSTVIPKGSAVMMKSADVVTVSVNSV